MTDLVQLICKMDSVTFVHQCISWPWVANLRAISPYFLNVILRCKMVWPHVTLFPMSLTFPQSSWSSERNWKDFRGWARSLLEISVPFYLAMHVHLYYGFWRLSISSDTSFKKKKEKKDISLVFWISVALFNFSLAWVQLE